MYREFRPGRRVAEALVCEWERSAGEAGEILVLPDGCVDIVWRSDGRLFVAGPDLGPVVHEHPAGVDFVGVRLRPGVAATVLQASVDELRDEQVALADLWDVAGPRLADRLATAPDMTARRQILVAEVGEQLAGAELDHQVLDATSVLSEGSAKVADVCQSIGLSGRHLQRRFVDQVGYAPKTFARVMRFQRFLALSRQPEHRASGLASLATEAGYADQAHLTRECRRLAAETPAQLLEVLGR